MTGFYIHQGWRVVVQNGLIVTSSAIDKKLKIDKNIEIKHEIYKSLEIKLKFTKISKINSKFRVV